MGRKRARGMTSALREGAVCRLCRQDDVAPVRALRGAIRTQEPLPDLLQQKLQALDTDYEQFVLSL